MLQHNPLDNSYDLNETLDPNMSLDEIIDMMYTDRESIWSNDDE